MYASLFSLPDELNYEIFDYIPSYLLNKEISLINKASKQLIDDKNLWLKYFKMLGISEAVLRNDFWQLLQVKFIKLIYFSVKKLKNRINIQNIDLTDLCLISGEPEIINIYAQQYPEKLYKDLQVNILYTSNLKTLKYFIEKDNINLPPNILTLAAIYNSTCDIVRYLVEEKNISPYNDYAIKYAIRHSNIPVIRYLVKEKMVNYQGEREEDADYYFSLMKNIIRDHKIKSTPELMYELKMAGDFQVLEMLNQYLLTNQQDNTLSCQQ